MNPLDQGAGPSNGPHTGPPTKRKKVGNQKFFQDSWLSVPQLSGWLRPVSGKSDKAFCTFCDKELTGGKSELLKHASGKFHIEKAALAISGNVESSSHPPVDDETQNRHKLKVKSAEILLSAFFIQNSGGIQSVETLLPLLQKAFDDSPTLRDVTLGRTKCTNIITNCIAKREIDKLISILKVKKFSVLVDESTDITDTKFLCVLVQFLSPDTKKVVTALFELVKLDAKDCSAEAVYVAFKSSFESKGVPISNIVGMASDNASVMTGKHNSFMTRLASDAPGLVTLNCICHSTALVATKACDTLPNSCEYLIRAVATYVSGSPKRLAVLREFQELLDIETRKVLKLSNTRWLSMEQCVVRLLENWDALKMYFALAVNEEKQKSAEIILEIMTNDVIKTYLLFLKYSLNLLNDFNKLFQSRKVLVHELPAESRCLIAKFGGNFLRAEVLDKLRSGTLYIAHPRNFIPLEDVYLGSECNAALENFPENLANEIRRTCLQSYVTATTEIAHRLPLKPSLLDKLRFLAPSVALDRNDKESFNDLTYIAQRFGAFNLTKLASEWKSLPLSFSPEQNQIFLTLDVESFWKKVLEKEHFSGEKMFPLLEEIVSIVLSLPHSNAEAERIFSIVTDVKTKKRNSIGPKCLNALCHMRLAFRNGQLDCNEFNVEKDHLELHCSENLYPSKQPDV